jgi:hypothetical protein
LDLDAFRIRKANSPSEQLNTAEQEQSAGGLNLQDLDRFRIRNADSPSEQLEQETGNRGASTN